MPSFRLPSPLSLPSFLPPAFLLAVSFVGLGWLVVVDMLRTALLSLDAEALGPGMAAAGGFLLMMDGIPLELLQSLCRTDAPSPFSWIAWSQVCGMAALMTLAMMLPCATPAWRMLRTEGTAAAGFGFFAGYGAVWVIFAIVLATIDMALHLQIGAHLVSTPGTPGVLAAGVVIVAGLFQWMPAKQDQRRRISVRSRPAHLGDAHVSVSFAEGLRYAGCCAKSNGPLMATMLVLGMMNIVAMALLLGAMLLEKTAEKNHVSHGIGIGLLLAGLTWMYSAATA
ncbi:DUF2182 domain-containing protein [Pararhizobium antarcticum]|uniref:Metal-binding protein n=1 Tax=Pararhizobium antarcticum TaxID=1798805 RepID=A0A657LR86_9HYPH|nr:DUF2182 domain-containing protein [Pararhizobium antarcticum]OJF94940.1 hypothetical protein AX760_03650 [Pararhizobium antarcticum]OJF97442.1 hypothetical protein AX761_14550 [Rhizobium sp. 58]